MSAIIGWSPVGVACEVGDLSSILQPRPEARCLWLMNLGAQYTMNDNVALFGAVGERCGNFDLGYG